MKIPLATGPEYKHGGGDLGGLGHGHGLHHEHEEKEDKRISINGPGLIVAGMLMLTSFLIIPFLFAKTNEGFGFRRMGKIFFFSHVNFKFACAHFLMQLGDLDAVRNDKAVDQNVRHKLIIRIT